MKQWNFPSLRPHVSVLKDKDTATLARAGHEWVKAATVNRLSYEIDWLGVPIIQTPEDMVLAQELLFKLKPDVLIETGVAHGGSLIYYSSLFELLGKGKVIGIDIDIRKHNRDVIEQHPMFKRIELIEGSSVAPETIEAVRQRIPPKSRVVVFLDSDHTRPHVLRELQLYQEFVDVGSYIVVFDTIPGKLATELPSESKYLDNDASCAIQDFLAETQSFEIDRHYDRLYVTASPGGYLKRVR